MNINYCVLEVVEKGGLSSSMILGVLIGNLDLNLGYVAGLNFKKEENGLPNLYSLVEYVLLILKIAYHKLTVAHT